MWVGLVCEMHVDGSLGNNQIYKIYNQVFISFCSFVCVCECYSEVDVFYVDTGGSGRVKLSDIICASPDNAFLTSLHAQALQCSLYYQDPVQYWPIIYNYACSHGGEFNMEEWWI